jgi:hypothetical protein
MILTIVPCSIQDAKILVERWHRHHDPPGGGLFAVAVAGEDGEIHGAAIVGRPIGRLMQWMRALKQLNELEDRKK